MDHSMKTSAMHAEAENKMSGCMGNEIVNSMSKMIQCHCIKPTLQYVLT